MSDGARRVALVLAFLVGSVLAGSVTMTPASAQTTCDQAYVSHCVPPVEEVGDLNCPSFTEQGVYDIVLAAVNWDPHGLDADFDGLGCEPYEGAEGSSGDAMGIVSNVAAPVAGSGCDPSYPEICLASSPDLDCASVGFALTVIHDASIGAYDPHGFDADANGLGCESW